MIEDCNTAKDAWDTLAPVYAQSSSMVVNRWLDELNDIFLAPGEKIARYIACAKGLARNLKAAGEAFTDRHIINRIVSGLPRSYSSTREQLALTCYVDFDGMTTALLKAESRLHKPSARSASPHSRDLRLSFSN